MISVIIPTYNRAQFILDALESVFQQTYDDYEIIVIDDGSTDDTQDVLQPYMDRIRYYYQDNQGVSAARNKGISEAQGDYIAFLDTDDLYLPQKLEKQVAYLDAHPEVGMVYCGYQIERFGTNLNPSIGFPDGDIHKTWLMRCDVGVPTVIIRKIVFDQIGGFNENLRLMEDIDLWLRVARDYPIGYVSEILTVFRQHSKNTPRDPIHLEEAYRYVIEQQSHIYNYIYQRRIMARMLYVIGLTHLNASHLSDSWKYMLRGMMQYPIDSYLFELISRVVFRTLMPDQFQQKLRRIWNIEARQS